MLKRIARISKTRLSRRIAFWLFTSVIVIETIILIPSLIRREKELLAYLRENSTEKVLILLQASPSQSTDQEILKLLENLDFNSVILGGSLYQSNGQLVGHFGEPPELTFSEVAKQQKTEILDYQQSRYDVAWTSLKANKNYTLILRHNATKVQQELMAFIIRIAGLVIIISVFVTAGTWIALQPIVITPILQLRRDLIKAGECICHEKEPLHFSAASLKRNNELGDVITAFQQMYRQISEAVNKQKQAEKELQISYQQVADYSETLNLELEKGRQMQLNFLPSSENINSISLQTGWAIATFFQPARQVAGDFYDVFKLSNGSLGLVIADVCDKGVGAALFMALFRSLIRIFSQQTKLRGTASYLLNLYQPKTGWLGASSSLNLAHVNALQAVSLTNHYIAHHHGMLGMFATLFFGILDPKSGLLTYINGGHESLFILNSKNKIREVLNSTGPAIGVLPDVPFLISQTYLNPGEILFGYTDGVPDARACDGTFFSNERLRSLLQSDFTTAKELIEKIAINVLSHTQGSEQFDDITLLAIKNEN